MKEKLKCKKGFTLIEMMIVIAIIGMLAGILLFAVNRSLKKTRATQLKAYTKQLRDTMLISGAEGCSAIQFDDGSGFAEAGAGDPVEAGYDIGCGAKEMTWKLPNGCDATTCTTNVVKETTADPCVLSEGFEKGVYVCSGDFCECEPDATADCTTIDGEDLPGGCATLE